MREERTRTAAHRSTAKVLVCAFMAFSALGSFVRLVELSACTGAFGPWQAMEATGNVTGFALLAAKLLRPGEPLTWLYVLMPQLGFLIEARADT